MILVAGSANLDFVVRAARIPAKGETVLGHGFATYPGGKGANQAVACARAGNAATSMLLALGKDPMAATIADSLHAAGVVTHIVNSVDEPTGTAFVCVADDGENAITVAPGANLTLEAIHLPPLTGFTHLLMQLEIPLQSVLAYARAAKAAGLTVVLNGAPAQTLPTELLALIDILVVNAGELSIISQHSGSVSECLARIAVRSVIVTLGASGAIARHDGELIVVSSYPVVPLDTTAAGDTFCGVLTAMLSRSHGLVEAMQLASMAAALACTRTGAQSSIPTHDELQKFAANHRDDPSSYNQIE